MLIDIKGLTISQIEQLAIMHSLNEHNGSREKTAKALDISIRSLYNKIKQYDLRITNGKVQSTPANGVHGTIQNH